MAGDQLYATFNDYLVSLGYEGEVKQPFRETPYLLYTKKNSPQQGQKVVIMVDHKSRLIFEIIKAASTPRLLNKIVSWVLLVVLFPLLVVFSLFSNSKFAGRIMDIPIARPGYFTSNDAAKILAPTIDLRDTFQPENMNEILQQQLNFAKTYLENVLRGNCWLKGLPRVPMHLANTYY